MVDRSAGADACWPWLGRRNRGGYGQIDFRRKPLGAHRVALELSLGRPLDAAECACHRCDVPGCVNPAHLFAGSIQDNNADCMTKGRHARGQQLPTAKLTDAQVDEIRCRRAAGETGTALSVAFKVSSGLVYAIEHGRRRKPYVAPSVVTVYGPVKHV